jgi:hypothetical protein
VASLTLVLLVAAPGAASAAGEPRSYHGTLQVDQVPVKASLPTGASSMSYRFHALYRLGARRVRPFRPTRGGQYPLIGRGNQTFAYRADLHMQSAHTDWGNVADWHGSGKWTKHSGNIALLNLFGHRFSVKVDLGRPPATIPLSVNSRETDLFSDEYMTCLSHFGQSGSTISVDDPCEERTQTFTVPVRTRVNPYQLFSEGNPISGTCTGPRVTIRDFNGFCGRTKPDGRIHATHSTVWGDYPVDYPFRPWEDVPAAEDAQAAAGLFYGAGNWSTFAVRTTYRINLTPG